MAPSFRNTFLASLPADDFAHIAPDLAVVSFRAGQVIQKRGEPLREIWFLDRSLCSFTMTSADGSTAEVASVGSEGFVGVEAFLGVSAAYCDATMYIVGDGMASVMNVDAFRRELGRREVFYSHVLEYVNIFVGALAVSVACNARHSAEERCSRWLLEAEIRLGGHELPVTHELLAHLLGVRRPTVSLVLQQFERAGIISTTRGRVQINDHHALGQHACECYQLNRLFDQQGLAHVPREPRARVSVAR